MDGERCRVAVCLNDGSAIQIGCSRGIQMRELAARVWSQLDPEGATTTRYLSGHFSFLLESAQQQVDCKYWLPNGMTLGEAQSRYMSYPGCRVSDWRYRLKVRCFPATFKDVVEEHGVFANHLYFQLCQEVHIADNLPDNLALKLAALEARKLVANQYAHGLKKSRMESLIRELGVEAFFPKSVLQGVKAKQLKKNLLHQIKVLEGLSQLECMLNYLSACYTACNLVQATYSVIKDGVDALATVDPTRGLVFHAVDSSAPQATYCSSTTTFTRIKQITVDVTEHIGVAFIGYTHREGTDVVEFTSIPELFDFVTLVDDYCQLSATDGVCCTSIYLEAKFPNSDSAMVELGAPPGMPEGAFSPSNSKRQLDPDKEVAIFSVDSDYYSAVNDNCGDHRSPVPGRSFKKAATFDCPSPVETLSPKQRPCHPPYKRFPASPYSSDSCLNSVNLSLVDGAENVPVVRQEDLSVHGIIGEGKFGQVSSATLDGTTVAVKTCHPFCSLIEKQKFVLEAVMMSEFDHPHITKLLGVTSEPVAIIMEHASKGELRGALLSEEPSPLTLLRYCDQLSTATSYLETLGFVHRDLAARNVLVFTPELVKLADFGLSRWVAEDLYYKASNGALPIKWMAPESINFRRFTTASDVWMFAVLVWEIMSYGAKPFTGVKNTAVLSLLEDNERLAKPKCCPDALYELMQRCWAFESCDRPSFLTIREEIGEIFLAEGGEAITKVGDTSAHTWPLAKCRMSSVSAFFFKDGGQELAKASLDPPCMQTRSTPTSPSYFPPTSSPQPSRRPPLALPARGSVDSPGQLGNSMSLEDIDARPPASLPPKPSLLL